MKFKILLVDDHKIFRAGVRKLLEQEEDMVVIGEAEEGRTALDMVQQLSPNVVVMDVTMPKLNGIDATRRIVNANPDIKVIALSMHSHKNLVKGMLGAGASGYLLKECAVDELTQAIRYAVERNQIFMSPEISRAVVKQYLQPPERNSVKNSTVLTSKEREILQLIAEGNTSREIAAIMNMSVRTVEKYRPKIMQKLQVNSLAELIKYAIREGLTEP